MELQRRPQTITHTRESHTLQVSMQASATDPQLSQLTLWLSVRSGPTFNEYRASFNNNSAPKELILAFDSLEIVYDLFHDEKDFEVDVDAARVLVRGEFEIRDRKVERKCWIVMHKCELDDRERIVRQVMDMHDAVARLKDQRQEGVLRIRKEYEQKLEQEKKRFQLILKSRKVADAKTVQNQNRLEEHISRIKNQMSEQVDKFQAYSRTNLAELKQLKAKNQKCEQELAKVKRDFNELKKITEGQTGRKKVKMCDREVNTDPPQPLKGSIQQEAHEFIENVLNQEKSNMLGESASSKK